MSSPGATASSTKGLLVQGRAHQRLSAWIVAPLRMGVTPTLLFVSLLMPSELSFQIGSLLINATRLVLLGAAPMVVVGLMTGRIRFAMFEIFLLLYAGWGLVAMCVNYGPEKGIEAGGVFVLETIVSYYIAKSAISNLGNVAEFVRLLQVLIAIGFAVALVDFLSGRQATHIFLSSLTGTKPFASVFRLSLLRAQGLFDNSILYGIFCAAPLPMFWFMLRDRTTALITAIWIAAATFISLSSGPFVIYAIGMSLIVWDEALKRVRARWMYLGALVGTALLVIEIFSNRSLLSVMITYLAIEPFTAWIRIAQWAFGWKSVLAHPLFGIGYEMFARPSWLAWSIDSLVLLTMVRFGIPALIFLGAFCAWEIAVVARLKLAAETVLRIRKSWVMFAIGLLVESLTVDYWGQLYIYFMIILGVGAALPAVLLQNREH